MLTTVINAGLPAKIDLAAGTDPAAPTADSEASFSAVLHRSRSTRTAPSRAAASKAVIGRSADSGDTTGRPAQASRQRGTSNTTLQRDGEVARPRLNVPQLGESPAARRPTDEATAKQHDDLVDTPAADVVGLDPAVSDWMTALQLPTEPTPIPTLPATGLPASSAPDVPIVTAASGASAAKIRHQPSDPHPYVPATLNLPTPASLIDGSTATRAQIQTNALLEPLAPRELTTIDVAPIGAEAALSANGEQLAPRESSPEVPAAARINGAPVTAAAVIAAGARAPIVDETPPNATAWASPNNHHRTPADIAPPVATRHTADTAISLINSAPSHNPSSIKSEYLSVQVDSPKGSRESAIKGVTATIVSDDVQGPHAVGANPVRSELGTDTVAMVKLPVAVTSPEFPRALGVQVSIMARNGLHQADLQLNPAEMGPISVRIEVMGTQTSVAFTADLAATRQVIEAGLPELASALREQGLTLSGGGVFQQSPGQAKHDTRQADETTSGSLAHFAEPDAESAPQRVSVTVLPGGVDIYA